MNTKRHPTSGSRQPAWVTRHSSLVTRHLSLCIAALAAFAASAAPVATGEGTMPPVAADLGVMERYFAAKKSRAQPLDGAVEVVSDTPATGTVPEAGVRFVVGESKRSFFEIEWDSGKVTKLPVRVSDARFKYVGKAPGKKFGSFFVVTNAVVYVGGASQFAVPDPKPYSGASFNAYWGRNGRLYDAYLDVCGRLPDATRHVCDIRFVPVPGGVRVVLDGSYRLTVAPEKDDPPDATAKEVRYSFAKGAAFAPKPQERLDYNHDRFTVLDLAANPRAKAFADAELSPGTEPGLRLVDGVPLAIAEPVDSGDVAICHEVAGFSGMSWNPYTAREPSQGFGAEVHFRLLAKPYLKAHVVFALDDAESRYTGKAKERILTLRLSRYAGNGAGMNAISEATLDYTDGVPPDLKRVGAVTRGGKTYPLYCATVGFDLQPVRDLVARRNSGVQPDGSLGGDYIDFDLAGRTSGVSVTDSSDSAFNIFGATLEAATVAMDFKSSEEAPGNVFTQDEKNRRMTVVLRCERAGASGRIDWTAKDVWTGRVLKTGAIPYELRAVGETRETDLDLNFSDEPGVYEIAFDVKDAAGAPQYAVTTRTAVTPPAERLAKAEDSPYHTWWFKGPHGSPSTWEIGGALMRKAGIRRSIVPEVPDEVREKYGIAYNGSVTAPGMGEFDAATGKFKPHGELGGEEWFVTNMVQAIAQKGHVDHVLVWHETAPYKPDFPEELLDLPVPAATEKDKAAGAYVNEVGRLVRRHFPHLRLQIGNSNCSALGAACLPFRGGADPQYYDNIGTESGMAGKFPEAMFVCGVQGLMISQDCVSRYAKRPVKATACFEYVMQASSKLGELRHAQWYMRDALVMLAHEMPLVPLGILFDCNSPYFDSVWGNAGIFFRSPYLEPKLAYVAYGALTRALDGVKLVRQLDTGSTTVYALLFRRADGRYATALWCAKGEAELSLGVAGGGEVFDMLGRAKAFDGKVVASESPTYVVTQAPVESVRQLRRAFPSDAEFLRTGREVYRFADPADVSVAPDRRAETKSLRLLPFLKASDHFAVRNVEDPEKGSCLEVSLDTSKEKVNPYYTEFTTLRLKEPVIIGESCRQLGLWVKGNSNWASICFEVEDAEGEVLTTFYVRDPAWKSLEWGNWTMWVNFDGWSIVSCAFEKGPWEHAGMVGNGRPNGKVDFPIKVRAVTVEMNRRKLDLVDFKPTDTTIRLGDMVTSEEPGLAIPRVWDEYAE